MFPARNLQRARRDNATPLRGYAPLVLNRFLLAFAVNLQRRRARRSRDRNGTGFAVDVTYSILLRIEGLNATSQHEKYRPKEIHNDDLVP